MVQFLTNKIVDFGRKYGLELHWGKTVLLRSRHQGTIYAPSGAQVAAKDSSVYLGGLLSSDGAARAEVSRRVGESWATFIKLQRVWKNANISKTRKVEIYESCIVTKLMYGLESVWLLQADRRRLDAFQARCLRRILGIPPSYVSRVPNTEVLRAAGSVPMTRLLLKKQLFLYGKVALLPDDAPQRKVMFDPGTLRLVSAHYRRKRGRPRQQWPQSVHNLALEAAGSIEVLSSILRGDGYIIWKELVQRYVDYCTHPYEDVHTQGMSD